MTSISLADRRSERVVVVGAGPAGLSAADQLRRRGFTGEVVLVGDERLGPYNRSALSREFLGGGIGTEELLLDTSAADASWRLGTRVVALDPGLRELVLPGAERLPFDGLVIATGVAARRIPGAPSHSDRILTLRDVEDARAIRSALDSAQGRIVIVGGGFVGCELACTARTRALQVTLVTESAPLLQLTLGNRLGQVVNGLHRHAGVDLRLGTRIVSWGESRRGVRLRLNDGVTLKADLAVLGLGGVPRVDWLRGCGLDTGDGVLCGATCHVIGPHGRPLPNVVAAGDVARWPNWRFDGRPRRVEHWTNAVEMGRAAADALLAGPERAKPFVPVPRFCSEQHGVRLQGVGSPALGSQMTLLEGSLRERRFVAAFTRPLPVSGRRPLDGHQVTGVIGFDSPDRLPAYRELIGRVGHVSELAERPPARRTAAVAGAAIGR